MCNRPPDKSVYLKITFLISQPKRMLWVLKRTVFEHPKHMFKLMGKEINAIFRCTNDPYPTFGVIEK